MEEETANASETEALETSSRLITDVRVTGVRIKEEFAPVTLAAAGAVVVGFLLVLIQWGSPVLVPIMLALDQHESTRWADRLMGSVRDE